jgi:hypothetical protein
MTTAVTTFGNAKLPAIATLASALKKNVEAIAPSGLAILKFDKTGAWVFGANADEVEEGSLWAVNPYSFSHGYIAWGDGQPVGEVMASMTDDLPNTPALPAGADDKGWQTQVGIALKCISGQDKGLEVRYSTTAVGGKRAVQALGMALAEQIDKDQNNPVAVVKLEGDSYKHSSYGKVHTPEFVIEYFMPLDADLDAVTPPAPTPAPEPEKTTRRRRA